MINNKRYVTDENLKTYTAALNDKQKAQLLVINSDIAFLDQRIDNEQDRAESSEKILQQNIDSEVIRAQTAETQLQSNLADADHALRDIISANKVNLQNNIDLEERVRESEISRVETKYDERIDGLDSTLRGYTDSQINSTAGTLRTELLKTKEIIDKDIDSLTAIVNENQRNSEGTDLQLLDKINKDIATVRSEISDHNSDYAELNTAVQYHINNLTNPHNITKEQIGAAAQTDLIDLETRVTKNESDISSNDADISNIQTNAQALAQRVSVNESDISILKSSKLNNSGNEILKGSFTVAKNNDGSALDGDLVVQGDLIVNGKTTAQNHETINVENNFIVVNSDGETIGTNLAGIAIRTNQNDAYGIAYDPSNDSVSLGHGVVNNGEFSFKQGENNPILTRAESSQLQDRHLLIWDAASNKAIDGGLYDEESLKDTFATWTAYNTLVDEVRNNDVDIANLQAEAIKINDNIDQLEAHDAQQYNRLDTAESDIDTLENVKQNIIDNTLKTDAKTIPASINEVHDQLEAHEALRNNPHNITWDQINSAALNNINPLMNGVANPGILTTVSRSDHIHPTDISRAPVDHSSVTSQYGKATTSKYGHVIVDSIISESSENPAQNKVIKSYIDDCISALAVESITINSNETLSNVSEVNGKILVDKQAIQINQDQVNNLQTDLSSIINNSDRIESESKSRDSLLQDNINTVTVRISNEETRAKTAETSLNDNIKSEASTRKASDDSLNNKIDMIQQNLQSNIDSNAARILDFEETLEKTKEMNSSIQEIQDQITYDNYNDGWVLSFEPEYDAENNIIGYKQIFKSIDDGEIN